MMSLRKIPKLTELAVFSVTALVCLNSAYSLFYEKTIASVPKEVPQAELSHQREGFENISMGCARAEQSFSTKAGRLRLDGRFCNPGSATTQRSPAQFTPASPRARSITIENTTSKYKALAYYEKSWPHFSTEFIPLEPGHNELTVTLENAGGTTTQYKVTVNRQTN